MERLTDRSAAFGDFRPSAYHLAPKCLTIRGWSCGTATDYKETMDFALEKGVSCMITPFQFEQAQEAFGKVWKLLPVTSRYINGLMPN